MSEKRIKFYLKRVHKTLVFAVLEMDDKFRNRDESGVSYVAKNKFVVLSRDVPSISPGAIYLWGRDVSGDTRIRLYECEGVEEAEDMERKVIEAIRDWAVNWEGWSNTKSQDPNTYIF